MGFKSERTYDMAQFGWEGCKFTFKALSIGEQQELDKQRQKWSVSTDEKEISEAANKIVDIMKSKFVKGQALDEENKKFDVTIEHFEEIPFDVFQKLTAWVTSGEVLNEDFLDKSTK